MILALTLAFARLAHQDPIEQRVENALRQLTLDEKIDLIAGYRGFDIRPIPKAGLPLMHMSDGPAGLRNDGPSTAYPAPVNIAAAFDPELARRYGVAIGRDARSRGVNIWLGPGMNLSRIPQNGRNFEYFGEDPYLASQTAVGVVQGVQSQGVVATIKHFAANNHENDRFTDSADVDERTMRELYLRSFEACVKEGKTWAVMSSYNRLNGVYASENPFLIHTLKDEWGFKGIYMSDWGATHSALGAAKAGLDLEMPGPDNFNAANLKPLIASGELPMSAVDDKVRRIIRTGYAMDFDKRPQRDESIPRDDPQNSETALQIAREGIVLLQNKGNFLPFEKGKVHRIVVMGPNAATAVTGGGGSSFVEPFHSVSVLDAVREIAGSDVQVEGRPWASETNFAPRIEGLQGSLHAEYFANRRLQGAPAVTRDETAIDHDWSGGPVEGIGHENFSVRWTGTVRPAESGTYLLLARTDDGVRIDVDGKRIIDHWHERGATTDAVPIQLTGGQDHAIKIEYFQAAGDAVARVGLLPQNGQIREAVRGLEDADAVVMCIGFNPSLEGEGQDRPFELPAFQRLVLDEVVRRGKHVVLVNNSGAGVDLAPWADRVTAILQTWYPGQNGNRALAEILFGVTNPSGKLPTTFPRTLAGTYYATAYPPRNGHIVYREGLFIGYRWFDAHHVKPLFPFGYGLSYTKFNLNDFKLRTTQGAVEATVTVKNTGSRPGAEVVQLYAGYEQSRVPRPVRELKGFRRVALQPGESKTITIPMDVSAVAYYDVARHAWVDEAGQVDVWLGTSSENLPLHGRFTVTDVPRH